MSKAIIVIPTYNERDNIEKTLEEVLAVSTRLNDWQVEILVVDDTSPDKTYELVEKLQTKSPYKDQLHLLVNQDKAGLGAAYLKGMIQAFDQLQADVVFEFDADLSHDPKKIPLFLEAIDNGADLVLGSRYIEGGSIPDDWGWHRKIMSVIGNLIIMTVLTNFSIKDWTTGYRAITKKTFKAVEKELHNERFAGYTFQIGFLHKAVRKGFKVTEVPFHFKDRTRGKSKLGPEYIKNTLLYIFKVRIKEILQHRIFKFLVVGGIGTLVQLVSLQLFRTILPEFDWWLITSFILATFLSIEVAIASNFLLNNLWTFADRKIKLAEFPLKFFHFNLTSAGSIIIQLIVATIGERLFGMVELLTVPVINYKFDSGTLYVMIGIILGLFWNFFAYNAFIWKKKK